MTNLLIHSMTEFWDIILGTLQAAGVRNIAEVGAEFGGTSQHLAAYTRVVGGSLTSIDPAPKQAFLDWVDQTPEVRHVALPSLEAIPTLSNIDAWVIDGDHNYYTVFNELRLVNELSQRDGRPLLALLHDVSWPAARRDMYYAPERIPAEYRHAYSMERGCTLGQSDLLPEGEGFRGEGQFGLALHEGGPRNGVLTAIEDFLEEARTGGQKLAYAHVPAVFGMGVLFDATAPWAEAVTDVVFPWHDNALLASLEQNRLRNYLKVIEWQDRERDRLSA
ncbi:class I SAM-dependent methyltransferase [uncultured Sphingomonas sp.]|uniref:class I SAM-dependent methyltransferase n=1 Tax=uncultured Sphingomonas sp. TaxID=158754 RepID=UPI0025DB55D5|nr:class I SAM-dependent methyltransferase [uncultured Sphingomonas sp.]